MTSFENKSRWADMCDEQQQQQPWQTVGNKKKKKNEEYPSLKGIPWCLRKAAFDAQDRLTDGMDQKYKNGIGHTMLLSEYIKQLSYNGYDSIKDAIAVVPSLDFEYTMKYIHRCENYQYFIIPVLGRNPTTHYILYRKPLYQNTITDPSFYHELY